ncbi:hypothetical protein ONZ45_g2995 [Pleurotus djamor]|nr:hypothetical protein ONZ45_g2995 [Pleurotus djamor]
MQNVGILMQLGNFSTAYFTIVIAVHTFLTLVLHKRQSLKVCAFTAAFGWVSTAMVVFSPLYFKETDGKLYGPSGFSCGITLKYPKVQIFTASVLTAILYALIFLVLRGTLMIKGGLRLNLGPPPSSRGLYTSEGYHCFITAVARSMLWYPFAYIILLIPYSITRMLVLSGFSVDFGGIALAFTLFYLLGFANVVLLYNTFRILGPAFDSQLDAKDMESFSATTAERKRYTSELAFGLNGVQASYTRSFDPIPVPLYQSYQSQESRYSMYSRTSSLGLLIPKPNETPAEPPKSFDREISPNSALSKKIENASQPSSDSLTTSSPYGHRRLGSADTMNSLPTPPRRLRSPVYPGRVVDADETQSEVSHESSGPPPYLDSPSRSISQQDKMRPPSSAGDISRSPTTPSMQEIGVWLARRGPSSPVSQDGLIVVPGSPSMSPDRLEGRLQLSAVASQTSFPSPTLSYYHSAGSPVASGSPRPLPPLPSPPSQANMEAPSDPWNRRTGNESLDTRHNVVLDIPPPAKRFMSHKPSYSAFGGGVNSDVLSRQLSTGNGHTIQPM